MERKKRIVEKISSFEKENLLSSLPFLAKGKFVNVATCSMERMPNVAPKLVAKVEHNVIFLIDYVMGKTYANLKSNPRISISFFDDHTLTGYQLNGAVTIIESGEEFAKLADEFQKIKMDLTVERILYTVRTGEKSKPLGFSLPESFVILKIKVIEIVEISSSGSLRAKYTV